jgi:hypothetical protein
MKPRASNQLRSSLSPDMLRHLVAVGEAADGLESAHQELRGPTRCARQSGARFASPREPIPFERLQHAGALYTASASAPYRRAVRSPFSTRQRMSGKSLPVDDEQGCRPAA